MSIKQLTLLSKRCTICGLDKSLGAYYSKGSRFDSSCKDCIRKRKRASRLNKNSSTMPAKVGNASPTADTLEHHEKIVGESVAICNNMISAPLEDLETHLVLQNLTNFFEMLSLIRADNERSLLMRMEQENETQTSIR